MRKEKGEMICSSSQVQRDFPYREKGENFGSDEVLRRWCLPIYMTPLNHLHHIVHAHQFTTFLHTNFFSFLFQIKNYFFSLARVKIFKFYFNTSTLLII